VTWRLLDEQNRELVETVYNYCRANATSGVSAGPLFKHLFYGKWEKALTIGLKCKDDIYTLLYQVHFYVEESFIPDKRARKNRHSI
jgi:hypothetical protein